MSDRGPDVHAIGADRHVAGLALAGVAVHAAEDAEAALQAWDGLPDGSALVLLTPVAAAALRGRIDDRRESLVCVLPEPAP